MNSIIPNLLSFISLFTYTSFIYINKSVLNFIECPTYYLSFHLFITFLQFSLIVKNNRITQSAAAAAGATITSQNSPGNNDLIPITPAARWFTAFVGSLSQISLNFNLKYNSVIFYETSKLLITPCILAYFIFVSPPYQKSNGTSDSTKGNDYGKSHIQCLLSFIIVLFGLYIFSLNDPDFNISPGLFIAIFSILTNFAYGIINIKITQLDLFSGNSNSNSENIIILKKIMSFPEFIITFILAFFIDLHPFDLNYKFSLLNKKNLDQSKNDVSHLIFNIILSAIILFYENIVFLITESLGQTSHSIPSLLSSLFNIIIKLGRPLFVIVFSLYQNADKISKFGISTFIILIGYLLYCFFELEAVNNENKLRKMKFQEEEDNLEEPLGKRGEEGIFHMALNTEEQQND